MLLETLLPLGKVDPGLRAPELPLDLHSIAADAALLEEIGYDGLVMTDDLSMHALSGSFRDRTEAAFAAGCDMALHCNGNIEEMRAVAGQTPELSGRALERANAALNISVWTSGFPRSGRM